MSKLEESRHYHADGTLQAECTLVDGLAHGVSREWHPNGTLAAETPYYYGLIDGTSTQWNDKGEVLGTFHLIKGTGTIRRWHPNGLLNSEMSMIDGRFAGRQRVYFEDGELLGEVFWVDNQKVSKKRYNQLASQNVALPQYKDQPPSRSQQKTEHRTSNNQS